MSSKLYILCFFSAHMTNLVKISPVHGTVITQGGAFQMCVSSTRVHVKLSEVFHWASLSDTLPEDLQYTVEAERDSLA